MQVFFSPWINTSICSKFSKKTALHCHGVVPPLKIFQFPIFSRFSSRSTTMRIIERVKIWLSTREEEVLEAKGARLYLEIDYPGQRGWHLHCVSSAAPPCERRDASSVHWISMGKPRCLDRRVGAAPLTLCFLERRRDSCATRWKIRVRSLCKLVKLSAILFRDREDRFARRITRFCLAILRRGERGRRERGRERGAHTILSYSQPMYRFPPTKTYDGWRVYRLTNSNGV